MSKAIYTHLRILKSLGRNKSGAIATLYKPQKGIEYWERQVEKYDKT